MRRDNFKRHVRKGGHLARENGKEKGKEHDVEDPQGGLWFEH